MNVSFKPGQPLSGQNPITANISKVSSKFETSSPLLRNVTTHLTAATPKTKKKAQQLSSSLVALEDSLISALSKDLIPALVHLCTVCKATCVQWN